MRLLLYDMGAYTQQDIMDALERMGIAYDNIFYKLKSVTGDKYFEKRVKELLEKVLYDAILSVNYYPILANICLENEIPYLSWSYDSPLNTEGLEETLGYKTNFAFLFDRIECQNYWRKGYQNVYHLPLAVNVRRLDTIHIAKQEEEKYNAEISMVGQLYDTVLPRLMGPLDEYQKGYLTGVIEAQMRLYGCYFLPDVITETFVSEINEKYKSLEQMSVELNRNMFILLVAKHITHMERIVLLDALSESYRVQLYGPDKGDELEKVKWCGSAGYFDEMPKVFKGSKINLNISLKCIRSGIPLRALDIMGSGGFLLTNYQPELIEYFIDGEDLVMYTSLEDAVAKCIYYLEHDDERKEIAKRGYQKVCELFTYEDRLREIFKTAGLMK